MPGTITSTPLTADERAALDAELAASSDLVGTVIGWGVLAALAGAVLGAIGYGVGSLFVYPGGVIGLASGGGLGVGAVTLIVVLCERDAHRRRRELANAVACGTVVEIRVTDAEVAPCRIHLKMQDGGLAVMLDQQRVLLLSQLAFIESPPPVFPDGADPATPPATRCAESWNGLAPPHAFPTRSFVLRGLESTGRILSLRTDGEAIPVDREAGRVAVPCIGYRRAFMVTKRVH